MSKNLYNQALYRIRQEYFKTKKYLKYVVLAQRLASEKQVDYISLPSKVAQWTLKQVDKNFISFFNSLKSERVQHKVHIPRYLDKQGRNLLTFTNQAISHKELKRGYLKLSGCKNMIKLQHIDVQQVRVVPKGNHFIIEVIYNQESKPEVQSKSYVGIDLGLDNLATVGGNKICPFIINGRPLKSINQYYNCSINL